MNMDTDIDKMDQIKAMNELLNNGIVRLKNCEGAAIELLQILNFIIRREIIK
jgi:hypothetical protein